MMGFVLVVLVLVVVAALIMTVITHDEQITKLEKRLDALEQQPAGFLPASYHYLDDVNDWLSQKGEQADGN